MAELVFVHGAADSGAVWELQTQHFTAAHKVLAIDLPGHGPRLAETAIDHLEGIAEEVVRQCRAQGFARPVLVGHSMGGLTALCIALSMPEFPAALVLAASGARLRMRESNLESARAQAEAAPLGQRAEPEITLDQVVSPTAGAEVRDWLTAHFRQATAQATYADFHAIHTYDALDRLAEVKPSALVIGGEDDLWTPPRFQRFLAEHLPSASVVMLPDTGHYPFVERAAEFNQALDAFLATL
jgi:3-oxoadipate enol-lactonase